MKKLLALLVFLPAIAIADQNSDMLKLYCRADPQGCRAIINQMIAQKIGVQRTPQPQETIVYDPRHIVHQQTEVEKIWESNRATYTNCHQNGTDINCTSQDH